MELNRKAERQVALLRWVGLAIAALMLADVLPWAALGGGLVCVALYNAALMFATQTPERYMRLGKRFSPFVIALDIVVLSLAILGSQRSVSSLSLMYSLVIISAGYVSMRRRNIAVTTLGCLAGYLLTMFLTHRSASLGALGSLVAKPSLIMVAAAGVTELLLMFKKRDDAMLSRDRKLLTLMEVGSRFTSGEDAVRVMEQSVRAAIHNTEATAGYIMLVNADGNQLTTEVAVNVGAERPFPVTCAFGEGVEGYVAQTGKPLMLTRQPQTASTPDANPLPGAQYEGEAILCIPLIENDPNTATETVIGVFTIIKHHAGQCFLEEDAELVRTLASLVTMAIVNSRLYQDLRTSFIRSLQVLARTLDAKDAYTQGHSYRVSELCVLIARKLRVTPEIIENLRNGALLHDVGKIGIPDAILCKPARLTDEEFAIMKQHPVIGYEICQSLGLGDEILMLIRNHHEKLDGTGYPDGLKLNEIPLPLRIICVADAFDAMSSSRPYRKVMDAHIRNEQLNRFAGTQFDPVVVETLKALLSAGALDELYKDHWQSNTETVMLPDDPASDLDIILFKAA